MRIVVFGLTISSSWGNGHATLWRGLCRALGKAGHEVLFFEQDVPYYAAHRDGIRFDGCDLRLYSGWSEAVAPASRELDRADAAIVTSYCPDGRAASALVLERCRQARVFYDLDTPVTLERLDAGESVAYLPEGGLKDFDLVLSFTGGRALEALQTRLNAREVAPLYGSVDPEVHRPTASDPRFRADLAYLGTHAPDRRAALEELLVEPARRLPASRFLIGGALYPADFPWQRNLWLRPHVAPQEHGAFFSSCRLSLNVTRRAMARFGWCPSGRLFEAAASGAPQVTDHWEGLESFFRPGSEILVVRSADDVVDAMSRPRGELEAMARAARERTLDEHTADHRAREFVAALRGDRRSSRPDDVPSRRLGASLEPLSNHPHQEP